MDKKSDPEQTKKQNTIKEVEKKHNQTKRKKKRNDRHLPRQ